MEERAFQTKNKEETMKNTINKNGGILSLIGLIVVVIIIVMVYLKYFK